MPFSQSPLLLFVMVPIAAFMLAERLSERRVRIVLFGGVGLMLVPVAAATWRQIDGSIPSLVQFAGFAWCSGLTLLGASAPRKFFWAFRALSGSLALGLVIRAVITVLSSDYAVGPRSGQSSNAVTEAWLGAVMVGLPCMWFTWKGRFWPPKHRFHVVMPDATVPAVDHWQDAVWRGGFDLRLCGIKSLRDHTGRVSVVFQGTETAFEFEVSSLARLVANLELHDETATQLGAGLIAANFRYSDEREHVAAQVAAAALTQLTGARMYVPESEDWLDGDDACEAARDLVLPLELHVLAHEHSLPTAEQWQLALRESGLGLDFQNSFDVLKHRGFLPLVFRGEKTGFAFTITSAELVVGGDQFAAEDMPAEVASMTVSANFQFADGNQSDAARLASAILAQRSNGFVYHPRRRTFLNGDAALQAATEEIRERPVT